MNQVLIIIHLLNHNSQIFIIYTAPYVSSNASWPGFHVEPQHQGRQSEESISKTQLTCTIKWRKVNSWVWSVCRNGRGWHHPEGKDTTFWRFQWILYFTALRIWQDSFLSIIVNFQDLLQAVLPFDLLLDRRKRINFFKELGTCSETERKPKVVRDAGVALASLVVCEEALERELFISTSCVSTYSSLFSPCDYVK